MDSVCVRIVASGPSLNKMVRNDNAWWWVASTPNTQYVCTRGVKLRIYVLEVLPTYLPYKNNFEEERKRTNNAIQYINTV